MGYSVGMRVKCLNATEAAEFQAEAKEILTMRNFDNYTCYNGSGSDVLYPFVEQDYIDAGGVLSTMTEAEATTDGMGGEIAVNHKDIILLAGQSNMVAMASDMITKHAIMMPEYKTSQVINGAVSSTGFSNDRWNKGDDLYEAAVAAANAAITENAGCVFRGILWHGGEADWSMSQSEYTTAITTFASDIRADIIGGNVPIIVGGLKFAEISTEVAKIDAALQDLPNRITNCTYVSKEGLTDIGDGIHFDTASLATLSERYLEAL